MPNIYAIINNFIRHYQFSSLRPLDGMLFMCLVYQCNGLRWSNPFELQTGILESILRTTGKYVCGSRERLKEAGLIDFVPAEGRGPATYFLKEIEVSRPELMKRFEPYAGSNEMGATVNANGNTNGNPSGNANGNTNGNPSGNANGNTNGAQAPLSPIILKNKTDKDIKHSYLQQSVESRSKGILGGDSVPTKEEVVECFISHQADTRLVSWEKEAENFYYYYDSIGWLTKSGVPIRRWTSKAAEWINRKETEQNNKENGKTTQGLPPGKNNIEITGYVWGKLQEGSQESSDPEPDLPF